MTEFFTPKQKQLISDFKHDRLKRINILDGSVRSGKTVITFILWGLWVATMPADKTYLMTARTLTTLKRNCLEPMVQFFGAENFQYSISSKQGRLFGRNIQFEGANDAQAEAKIRGLTLQGAYVDEITLVPEDYFTMLLSRLSEKDAKLFGSTNPDSPSHWLKKKYIDRADELSIYYDTYVIDDNTFLDPEYIANIKSEYTGVFYKRFILGMWVIAEGLVYQFDRERHCTDEIPETGEYYLSIDYGTMNPFSCGLWCVNGDYAVRIKEYYYCGRETAEQKTDEQYADEVDRLVEGYRITKVVVDPSAASFIAELKKRNYSVLKAKNDVIDGIRVTARFLEKGNIKIHESCKDAINEFGLYSWNDKSSVDEVIKENDHAMDEIRYFCNTVMIKKVRDTGYESIFERRY